MISLPDTQKKSFQGKIGFEPIFEVYLHNNQTDYQLEEDWEHGYDYRSPLINVPVSLYMTDYIYSKADFAILKTRNSFNNVTGKIDSSEMFSPLFCTNIPFDEALVNHVDLNFPERAYASIGFGQLKLLVGRDDLNWSSGKTGSLTVGDHLDYYDGIRFTSFHNNFKFTYLVSGFDVVPPGGGLDQNEKMKGFKLYVAHKFEFRLFHGKLNFALQEAITYQGDSIDFRYLNPSMFWHNLFVRGNANSTLSFELEFTPFRFLTAYFNMLVDEFPYPGEDQTSVWACPNGIGYQAGLESSFLLGNGIFTAWGEFVQTDPYLYLRDEVDYIVKRRIFNIEKGGSFVKDFLGYQYGPDCRVFAAGISYDWFDVLAANLDCRYVIHGENNIDTVWGMGPTHVDKVTPSGTVLEKTFVLSAGVSATPFSFVGNRYLDTIRIYSVVDLLFHQNRKNVLGADTHDCQVTIGLGWSI